MSKRVEQITQVVDEVKKQLGSKLIDMDDYISNEEVEKILQNSFSIVATKNNVQESTIRSKCTREIEYDTSTFFKEVIDNIIGGNKLINRVKKFSCSGDHTDLISEKLSTDI